MGWELAAFFLLIGLAVGGYLVGKYWHIPYCWGRIRALSVPPHPSDFDPPYIRYRCDRCGVLYEERE